MILFLQKRMIELEIETYRQGIEACYLCCYSSLCFKYEDLENISMKNTGTFAWHRSKEINLLNVIWIVFLNFSRTWGHSKYKYMPFTWSIFRFAHLDFINFYYSFLSCNYFPHNINRIKVAKEKFLRSMIDS